MVVAGDPRRSRRSAGTPPRMRSDSAGCSRTTAHSSSVSLSGLSRMRLEIASLPRSCSRPARRSVRRSSASRSRRSPSATAISATPSECRPVYGDFASTTRGERLGDAVEAVVVGHEHPVGGLDRRDGGAVERGPEGGVVARSRRARRRARGRTTTRAGGGRRPGAPSRPSSCQKTSIVCARQRIRRAARSASPRGRRGGRRRPSARRGGGSRGRPSRRARSCARCRRRARSAARTSPASRAGPSTTMCLSCLARA